VGLRTADHALNFANEGKLVIAVERQAAETALRCARIH
jgi:hydrogenase expression/formation protein HypE